MKINSRNLSLIIELSKYGLNPFDWVLVEEEHDIFMIISRADSEFQLTGKAQYITNQWRWQSIQITKF